MAEEHRCQAPRLCANNCGFFGCPTTQNLCSRCYRDLQLKEKQSSSAKQALNQTLASSSSPSVTIASSPAVEKLDQVTVAEMREETVKATTDLAQTEEVASSLLIDSSPAVEKLDLVTDGGRREESGVATTEQPQAVVVVQANPNRCLTCRKRVGLTGFKCRCGTVFCGTHRYPEQHQCSFDFKKMGKEQIAKANPVIKAPKLEKI